MPITKEQLNQKTHELLKEAIKTAEKKVQQAINSGAHRLDDYDNDYQLPKIITHVILKDAAWQMKPLLKESQEIAKNLQRLILLNISHGNTSNQSGQGRQKTGKAVLIHAACSGNWTRAMLIPEEDFHYNSLCEVTEALEWHMNEHN